MEITLNPEDNHRLANLCGALDENLKQIEDALDVGIARRGSTFHLSGEQQNMQLAVQLLEISMYAPRNRSAWRKSSLAWWSWTS